MIKQFTLIINNLVTNEEKVFYLDADSFIVDLGSNFSGRSFSIIRHLKENEVLSDNNQLIEIFNYVDNIIRNLKQEINVSLDIDTYNCTFENFTRINYMIDIAQNNLYPFEQCNFFEG